MTHAIVAVVEMRQACAFRADAFGERSVASRRSFEPVEPLDSVPRRGEGVRILHVDLYLDLLTAVDQAVTLDDMELLAVGRAIIVDEGIGTESDRVDHQRVAFVVAHRFAIR